MVDYWLKIPPLKFIIVALLGKIKNKKGKKTSCLFNVVLIFHFKQK